MKLSELIEQLADIDAKHPNAEVLIVNGHLSTKIDHIITH